LVFFAVSFYAIQKLNNKLTTCENKVEALVAEKETKERSDRALQVVLYRVTETMTEDTPSEIYKDTAAAFQKITKTVPEWGGEVDVARIGKFTSNSQQPRPLRITFKSLDAKHGFFRFNKALRSAGIRVDDDLTPTQQKERKELDGDFAQLKCRGHRPYFRGSVLKYSHSNKSHTCKKGQAHAAPSAA